MGKKYKEINDYTDIGHHIYSHLTLAGLRQACEDLIDEYGEDAWITLEGHSDNWDAGWVEVTLNWTRKETDKEREARLKAMRKNREEIKRIEAIQDRLDREEYERLRAKFEGK